MVISQILCRQSLLCKFAPRDYEVNIKVEDLFCVMYPLHLNVAGVVLCCVCEILKKSLKPSQFLGSQ
jgi:hypothetical protein